MLFSTGDREFESLSLRRGVRREPSGLKKPVFGCPEVQLSGWARQLGDRLTGRRVLLKPDGSSEIRGHRAGAIADAEALGIELARTLRDRAGPGLWVG